MSDLENHISAFIEDLGLAFVDDRLPRIAGRMVGLLLVSTSALSYDEMAARLAVSRASISSNARLLEGLDFVQRVAVPGDRRDYLQMPSGPATRQLQLTLDGFQKRAEKTRQMGELLAASRPAAAEKLNGMARVWDAVSIGLAKAIEELSD